MPGILEDWFPTPVWYLDVEEHAGLRDGLLRAVAAERERDPQGCYSSTPLVWQSATDLHARAEFAGVAAMIGRCVMEVVQLQRWDTAQVTPELAACGATVHAPGAYGVIGHHPRMALTGLYHLQTAPDSGHLFLLDPREAPAMIDPPMTEYTRLTFQRVAYQPIEGRVLIFPGWLRHGVDPNRGVADRVSLHFQIGVRSKQSG